MYIKVNNGHWEEGEREWFVSILKNGSVWVRASEYIPVWFEKFHPNSYHVIIKKCKTKTNSEFCAIARREREYLVKTFNERLAKYLSARKAGLL